MPRQVPPRPADVAQLYELGLIHVAGLQRVNEHVMLVVGDGDAARVQQEGEGTPVQLGSVPQALHGVTEDDGGRARERVEMELPVEPEERVDVLGHLHLPGQARGPVNSLLGQLRQAVPQQQRFDPLPHLVHLLALRQAEPSCRPFQREMRMLTNRLFRSRAVSRADRTLLFAGFRLANPTTPIRAGTPSGSRRPGGVYRPGLSRVPATPDRMRSGC